MHLPFLEKIGLAPLIGYLSWWFSTIMQD